MPLLRCLIRGELRHACEKARIDDVLQKKKTSSGFSDAHTWCGRVCVCNLQSTRQDVEQFATQFLTWAISAPQMQPHLMVVIRPSEILTINFHWINGRTGCWTVEFFISISLFSCPCSMHLRWSNLTGLRGDWPKATKGRSHEKGSFWLEAVKQAQSVESLE
jgi:hypothetical protein